MAKRDVYNTIIVTPDPKGRFLEGICSGALKPGTVAQIKAATEPINGRFTVEAYSRDADGDRPKGPYLIVLSDRTQGKTIDDAYADGAPCQLYVPMDGDEFLMLLQNVSGTADTHAIGEMLIVDSGTGTLIATTGTPEAEPFVNLETQAALTADTFSHVQFSMA